MRPVLYIVLVMFGWQFAAGQSAVPADSSNQPLNSLNRIINNNQEGVTIGSYAEASFSQPLDDSLYRNAKLDVQRVILFLGYKFADRVHFATEIEFEHVKEVYVEQAFLNYRASEAMHIRGGLLLIPMGIINEYHEPTTFNGVHRPAVANRIIPTTWREIGFGITGNISGVNLKYQLYILDGLNGYSTAAKFNAGSGLRGGRQKGANAYMSSPNFSGKIDFYGVRGLKMGLAGYIGRSQSTLFDNLPRNNDAALTRADSSTIGIAMSGLDARYTNGAVEGRAEVIYAALSNVSQYNAFAGISPDQGLGSAMMSTMLEAGYDVLSLIPDASKKLVVFVRYEKHNTQAKTYKEQTADVSYDRTDLTTGFTLRLHEGAVFKADYQFFSDATSSDPRRQVNLGIGIWF